MSDKGYLTNKVENALAKLADDAIAFDESKKLFGLFSFEKNDRKAFKSIISFIDDKVLGKNPNAEIKAEIDLVVSFIETQNVQGFIDHTADLFESKINLNLGVFEKQIYLGFLQLAAGFIGKVFEKADNLINEANAES